MFIVFIATTSSNAEYVRVTKNGDGSTGKYSYTSVFENEWGIYIWCQDPGSSNCPTATPNSGGFNTDINNVLSQISGSTLSGSYTSGSNTVTWLSNNSLGTTCRISIVPTGQTAHDEYLPLP
ncbi:MAG: hypothetical protein JST20_10740 [Bacteroidetes bacterium]|nr:hypothetical protein [Bacteroidota bacterium]